MTEILNIESERRNIQIRIDRSRTKISRNQLGQFSTPNDLAVDIMTSTKLFFSNDQRVSFLDPAVGSGSFFSAFLQVFDKTLIDTSFGIEIDPEFASTANNLWSTNGLQVINADFTKIEKLEKKVNLLVCNPPYVRHHHLSESDKHRYAESAKLNLNLKISKLSGFYCHFMLHAHSFLSENGIGVWLIPNEFMDVNYGVTIKNYLINRVELIRIHRFNPENVQFNDALVSSVVLWFKLKKTDEFHTVDFTSGDSIVNPSKVISINQLKLNPVEKWSNLFAESPATMNNSNVTRIKDLFFIKRGIATGNNRFFILTEEEITNKQLPTVFFKPILPSPKYIDSDIIEGDYEGNPKLPLKYFVLDCNLNMKEINEKYKTLAKYLNEGENDNVSSAYLCKNRNPWYSQEKRDIPLFVCNYIGRETTKKVFRFTLNKSQAIITNSYLGLYPKPLFYRLLASDPEITIKLLNLLNSTSSKELINKGRVYGGGMHKLEPRELENVEINLPTSMTQFIDPNKQLSLFDPKVKYRINPMI